MSCKVGVRCLAVASTQKMLNAEGLLNTREGILSAGIGPNLDAVDLATTLSETEVNKVAHSLILHGNQISYGGATGLAPIQMSKLVNIASRVTGYTDNIIPTSAAGVTDIILEHYNYICPDPTSMIKNCIGIDSFCQTGQKNINAAVEGVTRTISNTAEKALGQLSGVLEAASNAKDDLTSALQTTGEKFIEKLGKIPMPNFELTLDEHEIVIAALRKSETTELIKESFQNVTDDVLNLDNISKNAKKILGDINVQKELDQIKSAFAIPASKIKSGLELLDVNKVSNGSIKNFNNLTQFNNNYGITQSFDEFGDMIKNVKYPVDGRKNDLFPDGNTLVNSSEKEGIEKYFTFDEEPSTPKHFMGSVLGEETFMQLLEDYKNVVSGIDPVKMKELQEILETGNWTKYAPESTSLMDAFETIIEDVELEVEEIEKQLEEYGNKIVEYIKKEKLNLQKIPGFTSKAGVDAVLIDGFSSGLADQFDKSLGTDILNKLGINGEVKANYDSGSAIKAMKNAGIDPLNEIIV